MVYLGILGNRVAWVTFQRTSELSSELSSFQRTSEQIPLERELKFNFTAHYYVFVRPLLCEIRTYLTNHHPSKFF